MRSRLRGVAVGGLLLGVMLLANGMGAADAASPSASPCSVRNTATGVVYTTLQKAISKAAAGKTLSVTGTCKGPFTIAKSLTIQKGSGAAVLNAAGARVLMVSGGTVTLKGLRVTGGSATDCPVYGTWLCGGGIYNTATLKLIGTTVSGNTAASTGSLSSYGGGIYNAVSATMTLTRSTVTGNTSSSQARFGEGAGIANDGTLTMIQSTVSNNIASGVSGSYGGGVYNYNAAALTMTASTISSNSVSSSSGAEGGGIYNTATITMTNSTITGNKVTGGGAGGGIYNDSSNLALKSSTIARNTVSGPTAIGGGIYSSGQPTINSTIIALNTAHSSGRDCSIEHAYDTVIGGYNLFGSGAGCTVTNGANHNIVGSDGSPVDPKLASLAANGGRTKTLALRTSSPAIGAAGRKPCDTPTDQRGTARPQGSRCDIGSYEHS